MAPDLVQRETYNKLSDVPFAHRVERLENTLRYLRDNQATVLELLTEFSTRRSAEYELQAAISTLEGAVDEVLDQRPGRVSRMTVFMPSNMILYSYVLYLLVPSLFVEQIQFRPSSSVKSQLVQLHRILEPAHRLPISLKDVSQRRFLEECALPADAVVFTGAYQNAEEIRARLKGDQLFLFLGQGINPFVVAFDADLDLAVEDAVEIRLQNSGQDCLGPDVFLVDESVLAPFVEKLFGRLNQLRFGDYADSSADYGPIYYEKTLDVVSQYLLRNQAHIVHGGTLDFRARRVEPTVLLRDLQEGFKPTEFFSPIFNVVGYQDEEMLGNTLASSPFSERAMGASVYGGERRMTEVLRKKHTVTLNTSLLSIDDGNSPFGGYGPMANYIAYDGQIHARPILISQAVADLLPQKGK